MADEKAAIARRSLNKVRPGPPREFICLIGGPSNSFNGWYTGVYHPSKPAGMISVGGPPPVSRTDIRHYLRFKLLTRRRDGTPYVPDPRNEQEMREHGWWRGSYDAVVKEGWRPNEIVSLSSGTHDIYWGNFAVAASRLYALDHFPPPLIRPRPNRGDIVTFLVYAPAYDKRQKVDYRSSPYHFMHKDKPILNKAANLRASEYWKYTPAVGAPRLIDPAPDRPATVTESNRRNEARSQRLVQKELDAEKTRPIPEDDINFHIQMQMTADRDHKYLFRINGYDSYRGWIDQHTLSSVRANAPDVLTKVIFFNEPAEFVAYCNSGRFWRMDGEPLVEGTDYAMLPPRPVPYDIYGRPLARNYAWFKHWNGTPNVDRPKIKIARFDYFGHSDRIGMMLEYGWSNSKGEVPTSDVELIIEDLESAFPPPVLTADAHAALWGCHLGEAGGIGPRLATRFRGGVCAADARTDFSQIVVNDTEMPFPVKTEWNAVSRTHTQHRGEFKKFPFGAAAGAP